MQEGLSVSVKKLPLYLKGGVAAEAFVDADMFPALNVHRWRYNPERRSGYVELKDAGAIAHHYLGREVLGMRPRDGRQVVFKDGNHLNCVRTNLSEGVVRNLSSFKRGTSGKCFPLKPANFLGYYKKHHPHLFETLQAALVTKFSKKQVALSFEKDTDEAVRASHHTFRTKLLSLMQLELGFSGELHIVKHISKRSTEPVQVAAEPVPVEAEPVKAEPVKAEPVKVSVEPVFVQKHADNDSFDLLLHTLRMVQKGKMQSFTATFDAENGGEIEVDIKLVRQGATRKPNPSLL